MRSSLFIFYILFCIPTFSNQTDNKSTTYDTFSAKLLAEAKEAYRTLKSESPYTYEETQKRRLERTGVAKGFMITVDTRDQEACFEIYFVLKNYRSNQNYSSAKEFCRWDSLRPQVTVLLFDPIDAQEFRRDIDLTALKSTEKNLATDTRNLALAMAGAMGILWLLPESTTNWKKDEIRQGEYGIFSKYLENIRKGPVVDNDNPIYNWIGHPISGAAYYTIARHNKLNALQSFGYTVLMSTFFWEYGFEALAEVPSIQDLIITPVIGSLFGELFYRAERYIDAHQGKVLGSKKIGKLIMAILNPMAGVSQGVNRALGSKVIQDSRAQFYFRSEDKNGLQISTVGVQLIFTFY